MKPLHARIAALEAQQQQPVGPVVMYYVAGQQMPQIPDGCRALLPAKDPRPSEVLPEVWPPVKAGDAMPQPTAEQSAAELLPAVPTPPTPPAAPAPTRATPAPEPPQPRAVGRIGSIGAMWPDSSRGRLW